MKYVVFPVILSILLSPMTALATFDSFSYNPENLLSDAEMVNSYSMTKKELDQFLKRGSLGTLVTPDVFGVPSTASDIIWQSSQQFELNPKFLLVLLQREQSIVEDKTPTQDQLDWAMGYAVCDDCSKSDPRIQKFKGFGKQVYYAAERISKTYLTELNTTGKTQTGIGPGIDHVIDGTVVTPANFVTSILYTYTPHLSGNKNFVKIWDRWFTREYPSGSLLQDTKTGGIWLIKNGIRRPIQSRAAFHSRFNENQIVQAVTSEIETYPTGKPIAFPNYSLLRSPKGTVYLIVDDVKRGFTSQEALRALGYTPDEIEDVGWEDLEAFAEGEPITTEVAYPQGALLQNNVNGGIFFVQNGTKHPIFSREILNANQINSSVVAMSPKDLDAYPTANPLLFPDGTLIAVTGSPDIFVVADGTRHHILDEQTFTAYGWKWNQIIWTNERSVLIQPEGDPLTTRLDEPETTLEIASNL